MDFDSILAEIPEYVPKNDQLITIEDICKIHPTLSAENPDTWLIFKSHRPDLSEEDCLKIDLIVAKLHRLKFGEIREQLMEWRNEPID